jgi:chemosensory pili system protein ChpA (sensor histidine kinase/response regulator)
MENSSDIELEETELTELKEKFKSKKTESKKTVGNGNIVLKQSLKLIGSLSDAVESLSYSTDNDELFNTLNKNIYEIRDNLQKFQFNALNEEIQIAYSVLSVNSVLLQIIRDIKESGSEEDFSNSKSVAIKLINRLEELMNKTEEAKFDIKLQKLLDEYGNVKSITTREDDSYSSLIIKPRQFDSTLNEQSGDFPPELLNDFLKETLQNSIEISDILENYPKSPDKIKSIFTIKTMIHKIKSATGMFSFHTKSENNDKYYYIYRLSDLMSNLVNLIFDAATELNDQQYQLMHNSTQYLTQLCKAQNNGQFLQTFVDIKHEFSNVINSIDNLNIESKETSLSNESELESSMDFSEAKSKISDELYEVFKVEAREHLSIMKTRLEELVSESDNHLALQDIRRGAHIIKGATSMIGLQAVSELSYEMENVLDQIVDNNIVLDPELINILMLTSEVLEKIISENIDNSLQKEIVKLKKQYKDIKSFVDVSVGADESDRGPVEHTSESEYRDINTQEKDITAVSSKSSSSIDALVSSKPSSDIPPELLEIFLVEANKHLQSMGQCLNRITQDLKDKNSLQEVRRSVHTIKGAAGMVGFDTVTKISHRMEDMLDNLYEGTMNLDNNILDLLFKTSDLLENIVNDKIDDDDLNKLLPDIYANFDLLLEEEVKYEVGIAQSVDNVSDFKQEELFVGLDSGGIFDMDNKSKTGTQQTEQVLRKPGESVRIPIERLDELVNLVSELVVNRSAFEQHFSRFVQELAELSSSLDRLRRVTSILKTQYEAIMLGGKLPPVSETGKFEAVEIQALNQQTHEFDELEFDRYTEFHQHARELSESTSDIRAVGSQMRDLTGDFYSYLNRQQRITSEVQDKFMRLRMAPLLATVATRLHRIVRVTASQQNKRVQLNIIGEDVELDITMIEEMSDPLLHIIRNSVDHGVELPEHRKALNKNEVGTISLKAYYEGTQVVIQIGDDGAGLVPEVLRAAAVRGGFVSEADSLRLKKEDLYKLIFLPGFTSATEISEISGRGVGMDIVNYTVKKLKGTISVNSVPAKGVTFNIRLPMNLI